MFCFEHDGIRPDGLILGKALGGGMMPVSAFLAGREVMELFDPGSHGSTFGGNPLAAAVALEALNVLEDEDLVARSAALGEYMADRLRGLRSPLITDVRGRGLWIGVEFDPRCVSARIICETHHAVVRFAPPLVVEPDQIDLAVDALEVILGEVEAELDLVLVEPA